MRAKRSTINSIAAAAIIIILYFIVNHGFDWKVPSQVLLHASNATAIAGMLLILAAGTGWLKKYHMLDWAGYALYQFRFIILKHKDKSFTSFYDYRADKAKEYQLLLLWPRFWVGAFLLTFGLLLSLLFLRQGA